MGNCVAAKGEHARPPILSKTAEMAKPHQAEEATANTSPDKGAAKVPMNSQDVGRKSTESSCSLTESHRLRLKVELRVERPSEIDDSLVINKLADKSQLSHNNSIWNSDLRWPSNRNTATHEPQRNAQE